MKVLFLINYYSKYYLIFFCINIYKMGIGDWGLGIGDWGLGIGANPQSPIPNPQSPYYRYFSLIINLKFYYLIVI